MCRLNGRMIKEGNMYRFIITGETPAKKNSRIVLKGGRNIPSERYRQWHMAAMIEVDNQLRIMGHKKYEIPLEKEIKVKMTFYHGDNRRRDSDNGASSILDLLTDCNVIKDDKWQIVRALEIQNIYDKGNPRCLIEIDGYDE